MSTPSALLSKTIEELSQAIGKTINDGSNKRSLANPTPEILKVFKLTKQNVIFAWDKGLQVLIEQDSIQSLFPLENIEGLPKEIIDNKEKMETFLRNCNLSIPKYLDASELTFRLNLTGLMGGGNIGVGIHYWPLEQTEDGGYRFVIPYKLTATPEAAGIHNGSKSALVKKSKKEIERGTEKGKMLEEELSNIEIMKEAIELWNATGLVRLVPMSGPAPARWVKLTTNPDGICEAQCIGMCPTVGEHVITCDLEGDFHSNRLQSIMHEIGHTIGLRHEHVRKDRKAYIDTNFNETEDCVAVGKYDFKSIMHYELGLYRKIGKYLLLNKEFEKGISSKAAKTLELAVGKTPAISAGDKASVKELIKLARKEIAEKEAKAAAELKAAREMTEAVSERSTPLRYKQASLRKSLASLSLSDARFSDSLEIPTRSSTRSSDYSSGQSLRFMSSRSAWDSDDKSPDASDYSDLKRSHQKKDHSADDSKRVTRSMLKRQG